MRAAYHAHVKKPSPISQPRRRLFALSWRPQISVPCHRIFCRVGDRSCGWAAQAALPWEIRYHCMPDIYPRSASRLAVSSNLSGRAARARVAFEVWQEHFPPSSTPWNLSTKPGIVPAKDASAPGQSPPRWLESAYRLGSQAFRRRRQ